MPSIAVVGFGDFPDLLHRCIQSILIHTPPGYQLILCLNQPGDLSLMYAKNLAQQGSVDTLIVSRPNIGIEGAISLALSASRSPVMVRMDDDSWILRDGWMDVLMSEVSTLPTTWGAMGRKHRSFGWTDGPPCQGAVSKPWVRQQPWYDKEKEVLLNCAPVSISGGFCALNVAACLAVGYPLDSYPYREEDALLTILMGMKGYTIHDSNLISRMSASPTDKRFICANPMIAVGAAPSRTDRSGAQRPKWKGRYE